MDAYLRSVELDKERVPSFKEYPFALPVVKHLGTLEFHPRCTFLIGENGSGKSTLLEALAIRLGMPAEGGSQHFRFRTYDSHSKLHECLRVERGMRDPKSRYFLRAESFYNVATEIQRMDDIKCDDPPVSKVYDGPLHARSHGESFFALFQNRFRPKGLYLLDEPESALSPQRQLALLARMHELIRRDAQFVIATHSPILMAYPDAAIHMLGAKGPVRIEYEETEHYRVMRDFFQRREHMLRELLGGK